MVTMLIILIPVMCIMTGFFTAWGIYTGLKWKVQINQSREPTKPIELPHLFEARKQEKAEQEAINVLDEWLNGSQEVK